MSGGIVFHAALLVLLSATLGWGQTDRGSIRGTVLDPTGAVVPAATLTVTNTATGVSASMKSTSAGTYNFTALPAGVYRVDVQLSGFKNLVRPNVAVSAANITGLDLTLEVGDTTETVTVSAEAPLLRTESAATGTEVDARAYVDLPLSSGGGRRANTFILLVPGYSGSPGSFTDSFNGAQASTKEQQLEGASMLTVEIPGDGRNVTFPPDAVQEMSVASSGYAAEYGNSGGGVERYVLKSGTNAPHGSLYGFLQNEAFDARGYFNTVRPRHREQEYGGTIGGPIYIPGLYDGRNKSFFFFGFNRYNRGGANSTAILSVPTEAFRNGDFSAWTQQIYDPATTVQQPNGSFTRDPFPGNIIPANRLDPTAMTIMSYYPLPNMPGNFNNYAALVPASTNVRNTVSLKVDHYFNEKHRLTASLAETQNPGISSGSGLPDPIGGRQISLYTYWFPRMTWDWTLSPTVLNQFRVGFNRQTQYQDSPQRGGGWPTMLGLQGMEGAVDGFPQIELGSYDRSGVSNGFNDRFANTYTISDALSWTKAGHNFKFGFEGRRLQSLKYLGNWAGLSFSRNQTALPGSLGNTGLEFASFVLGQVNQAVLPLYGDFAPHFNTYQIGFYAQDDFKVTPRLTLNLGLRMDMFTPTTEVHNWYSMVDVTVPNPFAGNLPGAYVFAGQNGNGNRIAPADKVLKNFAPRLGFAYRLGENTVVRGGYGISYFQSGAYGGGGPNTALNDGYWITNTSRSLDQLNPAYTFANGFPDKDRIVPPMITQQLGVGTGLVNYWNPNAARTPYSQNWNLNVQRQLTANLSIDVGYVGLKGTNLPARTDINQLDPKYFNDPVVAPLLNSNINHPSVVAAGFTPPYPGFEASLAQALRPYPQFPNMFPGARSSDNSGNSTYHSLQVTMEKRFSRGFYANLAYTWSQSLTDAPNNFVQNAIVNRNIYDRSMTKSNPSSHRPHTLAAAFNYELPFGPGKPLANTDGVLGKIVGGWQLNGLVRYMQGDRISVTAPQTNPLYDGSVGLSLSSGSPIPQFADRVPGVPMKLAHDNFDPKSGDRYLNVDAFTLPAGVFGNTREFIPGLFAPAYLNEDVGFIKKTTLAEGMTLDIRFEAFNAFNRVVFRAPSANIGNPQTFGRVTGTRNSPRNGQIAMKLTF